jgi:NADH:ubiquinone oxidoreductase subunit D
MRESLKIVKQAINKLKDIEEDDNKLYLKKPNMVVFKPPVGEATSYVEAPRGLTACYVVSDGTSKPYRVKWRTGSFSSVQIMPEIIKERPYSDLMAVIGSLDIILPEVDR